MDLAMRNFFIFLPDISATVSANKMDVNFKGFFLGLPTARWWSFIQKIILFHNPISKLQRAVKWQIISNRALASDGFTNI